MKQNPSFITDKNNPHIKTASDKEYTWLLIDCTTGVMVEKTNKESGEVVRLFCPGGDFEKFFTVSDVLHANLYAPTDEELSEIKEWRKIEKQKPTMREPVYMQDIRKLHRDLIKWYLYCSDWLTFCINEFKSKTEEVKAMRYDKDKINTGTSDQTGDRVERRMTDPKHCMYERIVRAILETHNFYVIEKPKMAEFMEKKYEINEHGKKKYIARDLMEMFDISETTENEWKKAIINHVAAKIGFELPPE